MTPATDLRRVTQGTRVQDALLVLEIEQRGSEDAPFTVLTLGNRSGRIASAPFWSEEAHKVAGVARGDVAQVIGEVGSYRDRLQLKVSSLRVLPRDSIDWRGLVPSIDDPTPFWETLDRWRRDIVRPRLRAVLDLFYEDQDFRRRYQECPASLSGHHAVLGGLLKHTTEVAAIARAIARVSGAEADLVLAGVLLHDMGKLESYRWDEGHFAMTDAGSLHGHVVLGVLLLDRAVQACASPPCTAEELALLHHLILSHHGKQEFGAPVPPMTLEAEVLHYADNASAKTASMAEALADAANFAGEELVTSRTLWQLDRRRAYRGRSDWGGGTPQ